MKKLKFLVFASFIIMSFTSFGQKLIDKNGSIQIYSKTPMFIIEANNKTAASILNVTTGEIVVSTLVRSFKFHEALVEEHFNENYMESHLFPKSTFKGKIVNNASVNYKKDGSYPVVVEGDLNMHGVTNHVKENGTITVKGGKVSSSIDIHVSLAAYKIKVEESYKDRINDDVKLTIKFNFAPVTQ